LVNKRKVSPRNFFLRIPNDDEGQAFYKQLKRYLNSNSYTLDRKASGKRIEVTGRKALNTVMSDADSVRVYLVAKTPQGNRQLGYAVRSKIGHTVIQSKEPRRKFLGFI